MYVICTCSTVNYRPAMKLKEDNVSVCLFTEGGPCVTTRHGTPDNEPCTSPSPLVAITGDLFKLVLFRTPPPLVLTSGGY